MFVVTCDDKDYGTPVFWTGELTGFSRKAAKTKDETLAKKFDTASEAYTAALTRPELQRWRVRRVGNG